MLDCNATDEAFSSAAQKLRGLIDILPELPDEVQGALAMRVPGLLDLEPQEVRARLQTLAKTLELELELTARLIGKVRRQLQLHLLFCRNVHRYVAAAALQAGLLWNLSPVTAAAAALAKLLFHAHVIGGHGCKP
jgi:hypothetical protein